jgi:hypothetical protein
VALGKLQDFVKAMGGELKFEGVKKSGRWQGMNRGVTRFQLNPGRPDV